MPLTSIEQLDTVLDFLYAQHTNVDLDIIDKHFRKETENFIGTEDLKRIVLKLIRDQFCEWHKKYLDPDPAGGIYFISFEGKLLKDNGGYAAKEKKDLENNSRTVQQIQTAIDASVSTTKLYNNTEKYYKAQRNIGRSIGAFTLITTIVAVLAFFREFNPDHQQTQPIDINAHLSKDTSVLIHPKAHPVLETNPKKDSSKMK